MTLRHKSVWTTGEIRMLRELYPTSDSMTEVVAALPRHPLGAIRQRAHQLRLRRKRRYTDWAGIAARHKFTFDLGVRAT